MTNSMMDLKHAARTLRRQPGFSLAVALTLALGFALNAAVLGLMDALLLRPYQFPEYERLVIVWDAPKGASSRESVSPANYLDWRQQTRSMERLTAWEGWGATLTGRNEPQRLQGFRVSAGFFEALGTPPAVGRSFTSSEERPGDHRTIVIGDGVWRRRFGADHGIVGRQILLDGEPYTVVGIAPPGFDFPVGAEVWAPLALGTDRANDRTSRTLTVLGKLARGKSVADAQAELDIISARLAQQYPDVNRGRAASVRALSAAFTEEGSGSVVAVLQTGAGLVLIIACANLAGLLLARANDRRREFAVRTALGAGGMRIVRQLVTETALLAFVASGLALLLATAALDVLRTSIPADIAQHIEGWNNVRLDPRLYAVVPACAIVLGLLFGLIPVAAGSRRDLTDALKEGERGATGGVRRQRIRQALVVGEIAFALALLVAAGLALTAGVRMIRQPGGFEPQNLLTFDIPLPESRYRDTQSRREFADAIVARIETVSGIEGVALASVLPAAGWNPTVPFALEGDPVVDPARRPRTGFRAVSPGFFDAMRIPIVNGRAFSTFDREETQQVAIVSASLAARFWPGRDPVGSRLRLDDSSSAWLTVVGVAADVTMYNWWDGLDFTAVYVPLRQTIPPGALSAAVRTRGEPATMGSAVRAAVASLDSSIAVARMRTMEEAIESSRFGLNLIASLMGICGGTALVLSCVGIYSMMAYAVSQRRHEFGVRMALGATGRDVLHMTLRQAGILTAAGLAIGLAVAALLARGMSAALFGVIALDATTFAAVSIPLAVVSFGAAYLPARRSLRFDPATILRAE